jgi:hypothetical protein
LRQDISVLVPFDAAGWDWGSAGRHAATAGGRPCVAASGSSPVVTDVVLVDGTIELELVVSAERAFHGVVWRFQDSEHYESFFVRPHQVGNPDSIQYTPVSNGLSSWQLYHGESFWAPVAFPLGDWFRIRVVFAGRRAEAYVADLETPALVTTLRRPVAGGRVGVLVGGPEVRLGGFWWDGSAVFRGRPPVPQAPVAGALLAWEVSEPLPEAALADALAARRTWTAIDSEPSGLLDFSRLHGIRDGRNTVLARTTIDMPSARSQLVELGFSDRAVVYLNGVPLYRGDDTYRSRDYRFLGSIGWFDALYLPLRAGTNELMVAVSEDFGGWGVQARLADQSMSQSATPSPQPPSMTIS